MYKITDVVEMGHSKFTGASVQISLSFKDILSEEDRDLVLGIIDELDHTLLTNDIDYIPFSERFFIVEAKNPFYDIHYVIYYLIKRHIKRLKCKKISITIGKETYTQNIKGLK